MARSIFWLLGWWSRSRVRPEMNRNRLIRTESRRRERKGLTGLASSSLLLLGHPAGFISISITRSHARAGGTLDGLLTWSRAGHPAVLFEVVHICRTLIMRFSSDSRGRAREHGAFQPLSIAQEASVVGDVHVYPLVDPQNVCRLNYPQDSCSRLSSPFLCHATPPPSTQGR